MKKILLPALIFLLLIAGIVCFFTLRDSEEAKVKKVLQTLCRMASKNRGENAAAAALMISRTDRIFAGEFDIDIGQGMFNGKLNPTKMTSELARYRAIFEQVAVKAQDIEISFPDPAQAAVIFSGTLQGTTKNGKSISEARDVECLLIKQPNGWLISRLIIRDVLER